MSCSGIDIFCGTAKACKPAHDMVPRYHSLYFSFASIGAYLRGSQLKFDLLIFAVSSRVAFFVVVYGANGSSKHGGAMSWSHAMVECIAHSPMQVLLLLKVVVLVLKNLSSI